MVSRYEFFHELFQPTLPVRGATEFSSFMSGVMTISTHAPRAGSDMQYGAGFAGGIISTHAPRAGSDLNTSKSNSSLPYFNPRSPCGERPATFVKCFC